MNRYTSVDLLLFIGGVAIGLSVSFGKQWEKVLCLAVGTGCIMIAMRIRKKIHDEMTDENL